MGIKSRSKGTRGEVELRKLLDHIDGVSVKSQPSSGAFGSRIGSRGLQGDLKLTMGDTAYLVEVKRRKEAPKVLDGWLSGLDVLAIRGDFDEWRFYLPQAIFLDLIGLAAEGLAKRGDK
jgi:hypothetical protein